MGPGNSLKAGEPSNKLDAIAQQHDKEYESVERHFKKTKNLKEFTRQVHESDDKFIKEVSAYKPETYTTRPLGESH